MNCPHPPLFCNNPLQSRNRHLFRIHTDRFFRLQSLNFHLRPWLKINKTAMLFGNSHRNFGYRQIQDNQKPCNNKPFPQNKDPFPWPFDNNPESFANQNCRLKYQIPGLFRFSYKNQPQSFELRSLLIYLKI